AGGDTVHGKSDFAARGDSYGFRFAPQCPGFVRVSGLQLLEASVPALAIPATAHGGTQGAGGAVGTEASRVGLASAFKTKLELVGGEGAGVEFLQLQVEHGSVVSRACNAGIRIEV